MCPPWRDLEGESQQRQHQRNSDRHPTDGRPSKAKHPIPGLIQDALDGNGILVRQIQSTNRRTLSTLSRNDWTRSTRVFTRNDACKRGTPSAWRRS